MVWALKGAADTDVVVPAEFVSFCNNKGPFGFVTVTDQDVLLERPEHCRAVSVCPRISLVPPLADMSAAILPRWVIMDKCSS